MANIPIFCINSCGVSVPKNPPPDMIVGGRRIEDIEVYGRGDDCESE